MPAKTFANLSKETLILVGVQAPAASPATAVLNLGCPTHRRLHRRQPYECALTVSLHAQKKGLISMLSPILGYRMQKTVLHILLPFKFQRRSEGSTTTRLSTCAAPHILMPSHIHETRQIQ